MARAARASVREGKAVGRIIRTCKVDYEYGINTTSGGYIKICVQKKGVRRFDFPYNLDGPNDGL